MLINYRARHICFHARKLVVNREETKLLRSSSALASNWIIAVFMHEIFDPIV